MERTTTQTKNNAKHPKGEAVKVLQQKHIFDSRFIAVSQQQYFEMFNKDYPIKWVNTDNLREVLQDLVVWTSGRPQQQIYPHELMERFAVLFKEVKP